MSRYRTQIRVGRYLINFWKEGRCIASCKIDAPTKTLAWLNMLFERPEYLRHKLEADKITVTRMRKTARAVTFDVHSV